MAACRFGHVPPVPGTARRVILGKHGIAWANMGVKGNCLGSNSGRTGICVVSSTAYPNCSESGQGYSEISIHSCFVRAASSAKAGDAASGIGARRPVSRVLSALSQRGTTIPLGRASRCASRDLPGRRGGNAPAPLRARPSLFGLAPGGVYPAAPVARSAVRSCRTVSPLPAGCRMGFHAILAWAVCFLWHCPWGRPRRRLAGTVFPWSPDFPPPSPESGTGDDSGRPAVWRKNRCAGGVAGVKCRGGGQVREKLAYRPVGPPVRRPRTGTRNRPRS